jgi:hypothetical protein
MNRQLLLQNTPVLEDISLCELEPEVAVEVVNVVPSKE